MLLSKFSDEWIEAGVDEAGRGALAGPVVAAAVVLPTNYQNSRIKDSKLLSAELRQELRQEIINDALAYAIGIIDEKRIDTINILHASFEAMHAAIDQLPLVPELLLIDGNRFKPHIIKHQCIIKGDNKYQSIAAASILAKTERDAIMCKLHDQFPHYGWDKNKGYPTVMHRKAIHAFGLSIHHRLGFNCMGNVSLKLFNN